MISYSTFDSILCYNWSRISIEKGTQSHRKHLQYFLVMSLTVVTMLALQLLFPGWAAPFPLGPKLDKGAGALPALTLLYRIHQIEGYNVNGNVSPAFSFSQRACQS